MTHLFAEIRNLGCLKPIQAGYARHPTIAPPRMHDRRRLALDEDLAPVGGADVGGVAVPRRVDLFIDGHHEVPGVV